MVLCMSTANVKLRFDSDASKTTAGAYYFNFSKVNGYFQLSFKDIVASSTKLWNYRTRIDRFGMQYAWLESSSEGQYF